MNGNRNGSTNSLSEQNSSTDLNKKGQTSDMTDDKIDANKTADIEEQLGKLPDFLSDDEKTDTKPVIKQEPMGPVLCAADFDRLREVMRHDTYTHCDVHKLERMERNVVCIQCQQLICALCLLNSHQSHDIRSVSSMNEYFNVKGTIEDDVSVLQQEQNNLTVMFAQRKELKKKIEESSQNLVKDIGKRFDAIQNILHAKQEQLTAYVKQFESQNITELTRELDKIRDLENAASRMITRAITFFSKIDLTLATVLPKEVHDVIDKCKCASIESLQNKEKYLPERKFSKLLPSLDAVASICDTIHAEATKVVWSKTTKNSESDEKKAVKVKTEKRKHHSHSDHSSDTSKTFKKPKTATLTTVSSQSSAPLSIPSHRSSTEKSDSLEMDKNKRNTEKSLFESITENVNVKDTVQGSKVSHHRKSVDSATIQSPRHSTDIDDSESDKSDASIITPPKLRLVDMKTTNVEIGKCLLAKVSEEDGQGEKLLLGKICGSSKMKETTQYTVNWLKGEAGRDTTFEIRKKHSPLHSSCVLCNFDFDHAKPMSQELKSELVLAKEYHNKKKTRKRKPKERNVSPKKDKDSSKTQTVVKK
ncbi:uncharacterized protein LOC127737686 isoform X1 [Mytilus californianus]|uniref:uncharacterized protein LOC127737686 isoform X1 n=2 Tax=Mytilus californianus TaxID=6549 RepID=UPI002245C9F0|nr:uncharacterized protein LOC127737686 isoform X1 [Mytilus californianus]